MEKNTREYQLRPRHDDIWTNKKKDERDHILLIELKHLNEKLQESVDQLQSIEEGNHDECNVVQGQDDKDQMIQSLEKQLKLTKQRVDELEIQADELKRELKIQRQQVENLLQKQSCDGSTLSNSSSKESQITTTCDINPNNLLSEFLGKDYQEVLENCLHFHVNVLGKDIRTILLDVRKKGQEILDILCKTFTFGHCDEYCLSLPRTRKQEKTEIVKRAFNKCESSDCSSKFCVQLDKPLKHQFDFSIKPYLLYLSKCKSSQEEEADSYDNEDSILDYRLQQTPSMTDSDEIIHRLTANDRQFYQMWTGIVQGACPVNRKTAVKLAALLTQIYCGDKSAGNPLNDMEYSVKVFLPKNFWDHRISVEVDKEHCQLRGTHHSTQDHIAHVVEIYKQLLTHDGICYDVAVPKKSKVIGMIPRMRMKQFIFGISQRGVHKICRKTGEVLFTHRFSDIYQITLGKDKNIFSLNFKGWDTEFIACSSQSEEICDIIQLFIREMIEQVQQCYSDKLKSESLSSSTKCSVDAEPNSKSNLLLS